jgi:hypothetical protein
VSGYLEPSCKARDIQTTMGKQVTTLQDRARMQQKGTKETDEPESIIIVNVARGRRTLNDATIGTSTTSTTQPITEITVDSTLVHNRLQ